MQSSYKAYDGTQQYNQNPTNYTNINNQQLNNPSRHRQKSTQNNNV
jgi:hypothetical protein